MPAVMDHDDSSSSSSRHHPSPPPPIRQPIAIRPSVHHYLPTAQTNGDGHSLQQLRIPAETTLSLVDIDERNQVFLDNLNRKGGSIDSLDCDVDSMKRINHREDIGLDDQELILIPTKNLNKLLKKKNVSKERAKEIKAERRTLKNRGYAANCRVKRDDEETTLSHEIRVLDQKLEIREKEVREIEDDLERKVQEEKRALAEQIRLLRAELGLDGQQPDINVEP